MAPKILFLDDNTSRHRAMKPYLLHHEAYTALEAIDLLSHYQYDFVFLDHDLGGEEGVSSEKSNSGAAVARWIAETKPKIGIIIIHSLNPAGALNMESVLLGAGYRVLKIPFLTLRDQAEKVISDFSMILEKSP